MALHISRDGAEIGAWTEEEVRGFYREGSLLATDHYWMEGMTEWQPLSSLVEPPVPASPVAAPLPPPVVPPAVAAPQSAPAAIQPSPAKVKPKLSMVTAIASAVGAVVGIVLAQQFPDYAKYGFIGALLGAALGTIPYVMGRFALKTAKLRHSIAFGVLLGFLAGLAITPWLVAREFDDALEQASATLNQQCPKRIDIVTRIDGSSVAPGRKFIYRYTILPDNAFNPDELQAKLRPALIKSWETNPSIDLYRQMGVTLEYEYFTQDKHPLATITFNANEVPKE